jgi:myo-inositol-hexaphosphate 3-phosphohydrolase
MADDDTG